MTDPGRGARDATPAPRSPGSRRGSSADERVVRALLRRQLPALAERRLVPGPTGWDNAHWLLGDDLAVRLPRRALAEQLVRHEAAVLPRVAPALPLPVPVPVHLGTPDDELWPHPWSVVPWFAGERADLARPPAAPLAHAVALGTFLRALHVPADDDAPHNPFRGIPLGGRAEAFERAVGAVERAGRHPDAVPVLRDAFARGLAAAPHADAPVWLHGDLHPGNQLVAAGALSAVVDWGDVCAGDPASDLATAWWTLPVGVHADLRDAAGVAADADVWDRARGWAAVIAAFLLDQGPRVGDPAIVAMAHRTVARLGEDVRA